MADLDINDPFGIVDKRRGRGTTGNHSLSEANNLTSISAMKTRLTAISATKYSAARLASMTENDMVYAIRLETSDSASL